MAEPLLHAERVVAVPLAGGRQQAHPVQRLADPRRRGSRVGGPVGGVAAGQVVLAGQEGIESRALRPGSRRGAAPGPPPGIGTPSSSARPLVGKARPSSILIVVVFPEPFGPRKPYTQPRGTARSTWSTATWPPRNRLVRPLLATASAGGPAGAIGGGDGHQARGALRLRQVPRRSLRPPGSGRVVPEGRRRVARLRGGPVEDVRRDRPEQDPAVAGDQNRDQGCPQQPPAAPGAADVLADVAARR